MNVCVFLFWLVVGFFSGVLGEFLLLLALRRFSSPAAAPGFWAIPSSGSLRKNSRVCAFNGGSQKDFQPGRGQTISVKDTAASGDRVRFSGLKELLIFYVDYLLEGYKKRVLRRNSTKHTHASCAIGFLRIQTKTEFFVKSLCLR